MQIMELEQRDAAIDELLTREEVYTNVERCLELNNEKAQISSELEILYEKWEALAQ